MLRAFIHGEDHAGHKEIVEGKHVSTCPHEGVVLIVGDNRVEAGADATR